MKTRLTTADACLTVLAVAKDAIIYARISKELKRKIASEILRTGEAEAVVIRTALNEYFALRDAPSNRPNQPAKPVDYRRRK